MAVKRIKYENEANTSCSRCRHAKVCKYKDEYNLLVEAVNMATITRSDGAIIKVGQSSILMQPVQLRCAYYDVKYSDLPTYKSEAICGEA